MIAICWNNKLYDTNCEKWGIFFSKDLLIENKTKFKN